MFDWNNWDWKISRGINALQNVHAARTGRTDQLICRLISIQSGCKRFFATCCRYLRVTFVQWIFLFCCNFVTLHDLRSRTSPCAKPHVSGYTRLFQSRSECNSLNAIPLYEDCARLAHSACRFCLSGYSLIYPARIPFGESLVCVGCSIYYSHTAVADIRSDGIVIAE